MATTRRGSRLLHLTKARQLMDSRNMSFTELAFATGISEATLRQVINRQNPNATLKTIMKIMAMLNCKFEDLFDMPDDLITHINN